ncbi:MAG: T9SS type A sorting domain-containing protein [bacterium]
MKNPLLHEQAPKSYGTETHVNEVSQTNQNTSFPSSPLSSLVSLPGAYFTGVAGKYHSQTARGGLHNIQVDPTDPMKVHAVIMTALNVKLSDTTAAANFPQRNIYYTYSADGGITWKAAKKLAGARAGFPAMTLLNRGGVYVPVIGAHRYVSATDKKFISALYVEKGAPGEGNFAEVLCDQTTAEGDTKEILWPSITVSKDNKQIFMVSSVNRTVSSDPLYHLQFSSFTIDELGNPVWSGWRFGPASDVDLGLTTNGDYQINVSKSGKLGVVWIAYDFATPDRSVYLSESADTGKTWSNPEVVYTPVATQTQGGNINFDASGLDFFYDNAEAANVVIPANYELGTETSNTYLPATGSILFWKKGMTLPNYIIGRNSDNDLGSPQLDGSWLSDWANNIGVDPQGANLNYPTIAHGSDDSKWSIFFEAWAQDDTANYLLPYQASDGSDTSIIYPYHGIYRIDTKDGGATFGAPVVIRKNDLAAAGNTKMDFHYPQVSSFTPISGGALHFMLMYGADSAAGLSVPGYPGLPGYDDMQWYSEANTRNSMKFVGDNNIADIQNFPNPFTTATTFEVQLKNDEHVSLSVTDILGRVTRVVYSGSLAAGSHQIQFDAAHLAAGIYTYSLKTASGTISRTMSVIK